MLEVGAVAGRFTIAGLAAAAAWTARASPHAWSRRSPPGSWCGSRAASGSPTRSSATPSTTAWPTRRGELHEAVRGRWRPPRRRRRRRPAPSSPTTRWPPPAPVATRSRRGGRRRGRARGRAALGHAEAAGHYADALEALALGAEAPAAERHAVLLALAEATFAAGDIEAGRRRYPRRPPPRAAPARRALARAALGFAHVQPYGPSTQERVRLLTEALEALPDAGRPLRARVIGLLAVRLRARHDQERREALIDEALAMARRSATRRTLAWLQSFAVMVNWRPERAAGAARRPRQIVRSPAITPTTARSCGRTCTGSATRCRRATSPPPTPTSTARARSPTRRGRSYHRWFLMVVEAARAAFAGRLDEAGAARPTRRSRSTAATATTASRSTPSQRLVLARLRWRPHEADAAQLRGYAARYPRAAGVGGDARARSSGTSATPTPRGAALAAARATTSRPSCARPTSCPPRCASARRPPAPASRGRSQRLYELLLPARRRATRCVDAACGGVWGPVARGLGLLAAADDRAGRRRRALRATRCGWRGVGRARLGAAGDRRLAGDRRPGADRGALVNRGLRWRASWSCRGSAARIADDGSDHRRRSSRSRPAAA